MATSNSEFKKMLDESIGEEEKPKKKVNENVLITGGVTTSGLNFNLSKP